MPQTYILACEVFNVWMMTLLDLSLSYRDNKYILVAIDYVSKCEGAQVLPTSNGKVVIWFLKKIFNCIGVPRVLTSDQGSYFKNTSFEWVLAMYGVKHKSGVPNYHSQSTNQVENANWDIKTVLEKTVERYRKNWVQWMGLMMHFG